MKLLVISRAPWTRNNGTGNTLYDFFYDFKAGDIYSLCLREAPKVCEIPKKNFYISESQIIRALFKNTSIGKITDLNNTDNDQLSSIEKSSYSSGFMRKSYFFSFIREIIWGLNTWKNKNLDDFLKEVSPDVVFFPDFPCWYAHKILKYIQNKTNAKVVIFHADDCYTLRQFSLSPLFWLYRIFLRKWVRNSVRLSDVHYVISDVQKDDYDKAFGVDHKVLTKYADFSDNSHVDFSVGKKMPIILVFTGNIGMNRWKTLGLIASSLSKINAGKIKAKLLIYTTSVINDKMRRVLNVGDSSKIMGSIPPQKVAEIQSNADILVHVESFDLRNRLKVRQSFSTKIVDYLHMGKPILAVGPYDVASIKHLIDNKCAMVADNKEEIINQMIKAIEDKDYLERIARKGYECGKNKHSKEKLQAMLYKDIARLVKNNF